MPDEKTGPAAPFANSGPGATANDGGVAAGQGGIAIGGNVYGDIHLQNAAAIDHSSKSLRDAYLSWLIRQARALSLSGMGLFRAADDTRSDVDLVAVYTGLKTQQTEAGVLDVLNAESHLVLLGEPGSGKSTLTNFVALCMAGEALGRGEFNLDLLTAPLPEDQNLSSPSHDRIRRRQPWQHGMLLPVRVVLRDLIVRGLPEGQLSCEILWHYIIGELPEDILSGFGELLRTEWLQTGGLLLLDGLDEVPEGHDRRIQVKEIVEGFAAAFPKVRIIVTSRIYAYKKEAWKLAGFAEAVLAPFGMAQIRYFVRQWYVHVGPQRPNSRDDAEGRAVLLMRAIESNPRLAELASVPLLLTLIASLHAWRGGTLPQQRQELYAEAVDLLLNQWENQKIRRRPDGSNEFVQPSLAEWLQVDRQKVRELLERLAFEAHQTQQSLLGTADISEEKLIGELMKLNLNPDARPVRLVEYVRDRAGLLQPRSIGVYAFPHRTFQEFLAACYLTNHDFPDAIAELVCAEPNRWREVALLAAAKAARGTRSAAWYLAEALCYDEVPSTDHLQHCEKNAWGALLASQVLLENNCLTGLAERNKKKVALIRDWLLATMTWVPLSPVDQALVGDSLALIGDPRDLEELVAMPTAQLSIGSDNDTDQLAFDDEKPMHQVEVAEFKIGRYPVTVHQWRRFIEATQYDADPDTLDGLPNHPVVYVSWFDARIFCDWLTEDWRRSGKIAADEFVRLPTEVEWEFAARGRDSLVWPWGSEFREDQANTWETGIFRTTAVGSFPTGRSFYGLLDMAGNVFEWCQSRFAAYPYDDMQEALDGSERRIVRGGAFSHTAARARCACRGYARPDGRDDSIGFRIVVSRRASDHKGKSMKNIVGSVSRSGRQRDHEETSTSPLNGEPNA